MSDDPKSTLQRAYNLIEAGSLVEARAVLQDYLEHFPNDADGWWLYANAVEDPIEGETALRRVLSIDPGYEDAQELLTELEVAKAPLGSSDEYDFLSETETSPDFLAEVQDEDEEDFDFDESLPFEEEVVEQPIIATDVDDFEFSEDEFDFDDEEEVVAESAPTGSGRRILMGLVLLLVLILIVVVVFVINPFRTPDTQVASATQTLEVTEQISSTGADGLDDATTQRFYEALSSLNVINDSATVESTSEGETLTLSICSTAVNAVIRNNVDLALRVMADESTDLEENVDAIGIKLIHCDTDNRVIRYVAVPLDRAIAFAGGDISLNEFSASWEAQALN